MSAITLCQSTNGNAHASTKPTAPTRRARRREICSRPSGPDAMAGLWTAEHRLQTLCDLGDLRLGHLGEERQRDRPRRDVLAHREFALAMTEALAVEGHKVNRGQIGLARDATLAQRDDHVVARRPVARHLDDVDEPA